MWDLAEDNNSVKLIESFLAAGKTIAVVCHSTGALRHVKTADGKPLVQGKEVTGFTNGEEEDVGLTKVVPFLVEDEMLKLGAVFSKTANWGVHVVSDGLLITGQNPHSSGAGCAHLVGRREAARQAGCLAPRSSCLLCIAEVAGEARCNWRLSRGRTVQIHHKSMQGDSNPHRARENESAVRVDSHKPGDAEDELRS